MRKMITARRSSQGKCGDRRDVHRGNADPVRIPAESLHTPEIIFLVGKMLEPGVLGRLAALKSEAGAAGTARNSLRPCPSALAAAATDLSESTRPGGMRWASP